MRNAIPPNLNAAQTAIFLDQLLYPGKPIYNTGQAVTIRGELRVDLFASAVRDAIAESSGLRFPPGNDLAPFALRSVDFTRHPDPLAAASRWMRAEMRVPVLLDGGAPFQFVLLRVAGDRTIWFQKFHHIIIDATGRHVLTARTAARYRSPRFGEPLAPLDTAGPEDLLAAERAYAGSADDHADRAYWTQRLSPLPEPLLETDRTATERGKSGCHDRLAFTLSRADFARLEMAARALEVTPFRAIIALVYTAFARLYDRWDLVLGLALANRSGPRERRALGMWARQLPLRLRMERSVSAADAVRLTNRAVADDYDHRRFPVHELLPRSGTGGRGHAGLFDAVVNFIPLRYDFRFEDAPVSLANLSYGFVAPCMVTVADTGGDQDLAVTVDTDPGLIGTDEAAAIADSIEVLLREGLDDPARQLGHLPVMPDAARTWLLDRAASGPAPAIPAETLTTLCAAQAGRMPGAIAVTHGEDAVTYAALHARADRLARRLAAAGVRRGVAVGIALPRTPDLIVAVLAVHKAGGAYLPLDPAYPAERIRFIVADSKAPLIVTTTSLAAAFEGSGAVLLRLDADPDGAGAEAAADNAADPDDLAYVMYTSGSTGQPKAVGIAHRNVVNLLYWGRSVVTDGELNGLLFSTSLNFDLSVFEIFLPLVFGGRIVMVENLFAMRVEPSDRAIRLINSGPSLLDAFLSGGGIPATVTTVILCGERLSRHLADRLFAAAPGVRLLNFYGPTETTVYSGWAPVDPGDRAEPAIGRAIWNTSLYVLDADRQLLPRGAAGELFIGGAGVAPGYLGRPELTGQRFPPNPFGPGKLYRTGDRVRWRADGELEYLGRADDQIKINGIRIEPGEIEAALCHVPGVEAAAVVARGDDAGGRRLAAYLVPAPGARTDTADVSIALEQALPRHLVPTSFTWLEALPMTPNGKLDRRALPEAGLAASRPEFERPLASGLERELAAIWRDILGVGQIGPDSNFFEIGGHSLLGLRVLAAVEARYGIPVRLATLFHSPTIRAFAAALGMDHEPADDFAIKTLQPRGDGAAVIAINNFGVFHPLALELGTTQPFVSAYIADPDRYRPLPDRSLAEIAAEYVRLIRQARPEGPYALLGWCVSGHIAMEAARQMRAMGDEVRLVVMIDTWAPSQRSRQSPLRTLFARLSYGYQWHRIEWRSGRRTIAELFRRSRYGRYLGRLRAGVTRNEASGDDRYDWVINYLTDLVARHDPGRYDGTVLLIVSGDRPTGRFIDPELGWRDHVSGPVLVRVVPGGHLDILRPPAVTGVAQGILETMARLDGPGETDLTTGVWRNADGPRPLVKA